MDAKLGKPAQVIGLIYKDAMSTTGHSWNRLNGALRTVLSACISAGMRFLETDFSTINNSFRGSFWFAPENWYAEAVNVRNLSACKSLEAFLERPAFMQNGNRLCVGAEVEVPGEKIKAKVTSLQKFALIACTYKADISRSIDKRYTITLEELKSGEKAKKLPLTTEQKEVAKVVRLLLPKMGICKQGAKVLRNCPDLKSAWNEIDSLMTMERLFTLIGFDISLARFKSFLSIADAKNKINFEKEILPLVRAFLTNNATE